VLAMRTWIQSQFSGCASDPNLIGSWVAGALDSAWRAVDQYLTLHHANLPAGVQEKFWANWGRTEYWDESSSDELVELNRKLTERHLVISLYKSGVTLEP
jgi:hypothetical protein